MKDGRYEIENPAIAAKMKDLGKRIHDALQGHEPKLYFTLLLFTGTEDNAQDKGATFYISDVERSGSVAALREAVERIEGQSASEDVQPAQ